uniref:GH10 domain-containing protein n=1 Tax=Aegilops tauschii subsp. strangulata TaxID=200361 RepID=A0A453DTX5_AEGTS
MAAPARRRRTAVWAAGHRLARARSRCTTTTRRLRSRPRRRTCRARTSGSRAAGTSSPRTGRTTRTAYAGRSPARPSPRSRTGWPAGFAWRAAPARTAATLCTWRSARRTAPGSAAVCWWLSLGGGPRSRARSGSTSTRATPRFTSMARRPGWTSRSWTCACAPWTRSHGSGTSGRRRTSRPSEDGADAAEAVNGASIRVVQVENSFPIGACISKSSIQNPAFVDFFTKHFDWAVLENELKWYYTEPVQGQVSYADADELIAFCDRLKKPVRGHCIFWAVENSVQPWVRALNTEQLRAAVESRIRGLVSRYSGRFPQYEVNNEMLHGAFFRQRLGDDIDAHMFRETAAIDPAPALFVNDYNVESANDPNATPEKYVALITDLQRRGAAVGGIGVQGHVTYPVGDVICDALDKLAATELPVWITELDVSAADEAVRADDLEVVLREAFAHPAVEGIMLWGFMQGHMWRSHGQLLNADGTVSQAGNRFMGLRQEWTSHARGKVDANGHFKFRGFHGKYVVELAAGAGGKQVRRAFDVHKGDEPLVVDMNL